MMLDLIPMAHTAKVLKKSGLDKWGVASTSSSEEFVCRITYNSSNQAITVASGEVVRYSAQILFRGVPDVSYDDYVEWQDERGVSHKKKPLEIQYKHDLSGEAISLRVTL